MEEQRTHERTQNSWKNTELMEEHGTHGLESNCLAAEMHQVLLNRHTLEWVSGTIGLPRGLLLSPPSSKYILMTENGHNALFHYVWAVEGGISIRKMRQAMQEDLNNITQWPGEW